MHTRHRRSPARLLWKAGLSCLLAAGAEMPLLAHADPEPPPCREGTAPGVEMAPELLALADWPLDSPEDGGCIETPVAADAEPSLPAVEIAGHPEVVRVVAGGAFDEPAPEAVAADAPDDLPLLSILADKEMDDQELASVAPDGDLAPNPLGPQIAALDTGTLDGIRGGFEIDNGSLKFSFGIERAVYINGDLVASTVLNLRDLQGMAGAGLPAELANSALTVIQNGARNGFTAQVNPNLAGTVIQNTLNDQRIVNVTTINATVNSAQVLRSMALQSAIRDGVVGSLRR